MARNPNYFESICSVSRAFGKTVKKKELLNLIVDTAVTSMDGKAASLFLADEETDLFVPVAQKGLSRNYHHAAPEKARETVEQLIKKGHLAIHDALTDERMEHREAKKAEGIASILVVPVMVHGKAIGVLTLYTADQRKFTKEDIAFLTALAEQGGIAIERARLIEHIRRNARLFHDLSVSINASLDFKQIINTLTHDMARSFNAKGVTVQLLDLDKKTLKLIAGSGLSEPFTSKCPSPEEKSVKQTLNGETVYILDAPRDKGILNPDAYKKEGVAAVISAPIKSGNAVIGVLRMYFGTRRHLYDDEILMINAFAHQAGLSIHNAACYVSLEKDLKDYKEDMWSHRSWF
ncbi:MAG: GAF domain-containing protein [Desulfobacterales bacterium]|nr:GAF domain-containing protein [Desulfobacterales bacterium]